MEAMENYISRMNIDRYRLLLRTATDQSQRQVIEKLLAEEDANWSSSVLAPILEVV